MKQSNKLPAALDAFKGILTRMKLIRRHSRRGKVAQASDFQNWKPRAKAAT